VTDHTEDKIDPKKQKNEQIQKDAKGLASQGFSKEQIAAQLSTKHNVAVSEVKTLLDQSQEAEK
jgi:hypothetical protein